MTAPGRARTRATLPARPASRIVAPLIKRFLKMLVIVLLAVVGVLAIVLGVVAASRRGDPPAVSTADPAPVSESAPAAPDGAATAMPASTAEPRAVMAEPPPMRPLLRRMYAAVMDTPSLADADTAIDPAQATVLASAVSALDHVDMRPQLLPRRPHLLPQLMRAVNDPDASGRGIAAIIAQDPALAANLLRIANSALYRPQGGPLESLERAVVHIGTEGVRQIVAAAVMQPVLSLEGGLYARLPAAVWDYALRTATAAAAYVRERGGDTLSAQLAGLLQGLGAVVILRVLRDAYAEQPSVPYSLEVAATLVDRHTAAVAKTIATAWELPAQLGTALDEQRPEHDSTLLATSLGRALRYGRLAAALAMLARHGAETEAHALSVLATLEPDEAANAALWQRLVAASVE